MSYTPSQEDITQFSEVTMTGGCDTTYAEFHADLALYSVTLDKYCQLYYADPFLKTLAPQDGTLLPGSQHPFESAGDPFLRQISMNILRTSRISQVRLVSCFVLDVG